VSKASSFTRDLNFGSRDSRLKLAEYRPLTIDHYLLPAYAPCLTDASISVFSISQMNHSIEWADMCMINERRYDYMLAGR
jgi:hypothetical protein